MEATGETFVAQAPRQELHGTYYAARERDCCAIIQAAVGMNQRRYAALAKHLANRGICVITYDYSGTGRSRVSSIRDDVCKPSLWGREDQSAIIDWARARHPSARLVVLGHSVGGQIIGFGTNLDELSALVLVAAQSSFPGHWYDPKMRLGVWAVWSVIFPAASRTFGYLPGWLYGGDDLSRETCREGSVWAKQAPHVLAEPGVRARLGSLEIPVRCYSFTDDRFLAPREAVDAFLHGFRRAQIERMHINPREFGLERIGHAGFFSPKCEPLWDDLCAFVRGSELASR